ncbi:MAG: ribosome biosis GTPase / thiamine phosphate phosphatase [Frankiaceae bacterium]|jgi:ribosome biogenesis GTPase|nr:ribosome biosis GTPase / thiamine phosphate phosphatase [Frankiaceae bacterium]
MPRELDEDDVRSRPSRSTRRRSRLRPDYTDAADALVVAVDRGRFTCHVIDGPEVTAIRGGDVRRTPVVVGDQVQLAGDASGRTDTLARIVSVAERRTLLRRTPDDTDPIERPVVANAEQLVVVVALADPPPRLGLIDRCLVAAYDGGLTPVLCLTKRDLATSEAIEKLYKPFGLPMLTTEPDGDLGALQEQIDGRISVFFGHSGVGKSTLVNRLVPDAHRAIGVVNDVTGRGRHTSSSAIALAIPGASAGSWVIDTPGIRSFGLGMVSPQRVLAAFPDLAAVTADCPRDCSHAETAPDCALDDGMREGVLSQERVESLRRLLAARETPDYA